MKTTFLFLIVFVIPSICFSQTDDTTLVKFYKVDFAVPDLPAFNILGTSPSDILRPTDVKSLSVVTSEFYNGSTIVLPKTFSMEAAPFMLAKNNTLTLKEYDNNKWLYNFRLSIGTNTSEINKIKYSNLAVGARFVLIDDGDLKNDKSYRKKLWESTAIEVNVENILKKEFCDSVNKPLLQVITDEVLNKKMEKYIASNKEKRIKEIDVSGYYLKELEKTKEEYKKANWNKQKLEIAYAFLGSSSDSLVKNIKSKKHSAWISYANPLGTKWGQLLVGANFSYVFADSLNKETTQTVNFRYSTFSTAIRLYFGSNRFKGFVEGQGKRNWLYKKNDCLFNLGSEINIRDGIWMVFNAGVNWNDFSSKNSKSSFYSGFNLKFTIPEKYKIY